MVYDNSFFGNVELISKGDGYFDVNNLEIYII